jgi:hypothetical protein
MSKENALKILKTANSESMYLEGIADEISDAAEDVLCPDTDHPVVGATVLRCVMELKQMKFDRLHKGVSDAIVELGKD